MGTLSTRQWDTVELGNLDRGCALGRFPTSLALERPQACGPAEVAVSVRELRRSYAAAAPASSCSSSSSSSCSAFVETHGGLVSST